MNIAGILAGGIGTRMGKNVPKQFLSLNNIPIIIRVIKTFLNNKNINSIIVAMNSEWIEYCNTLLTNWNISQKNIYIIEGGNSRFESLYNITKKAYELDNTSIVISHDCARVFVSDEIINNNLKLIKKYDCTTTSVSAIDTIIVSKNGKTSDKVPNRDTIFLDQGPQAYRSGQFLNIFDSLTNDERLKYMEAGKLFLDKNLKVGIVPGERINFKMTTEFDMKYGEFLISEGVIK